MGNGLAERIRHLATALEPKLIETRRRIHQHPELGFEEHETAGLAAGWLKELGLEVQENICRTGVVALIKGHQAGQVVGLRAEMDALPLQEKSDHPYRSQNPGTMHACGHDAHVACLLGAAEILSSLRTEMTGAVKLIFQPSEEDVPSGALDMLSAGVLDDPPVDVLIALHVDPEMPTGGIGIRAGPYLAGARDFDVRIIGRGGHGAHPHQAIDAIVTAAHFVTDLQSVVSRRVDPLQPAVITVGQIHGGKADNIIADLVELSGTVRALDPRLDELLAQAVENVLLGVTTAAGARGEIEWTQGCAALVNDPGAAQAVHDAAVQLYGPESLHEDIPQSMGGDDFSYFLKHVPGILFGLGTNDGTERTSYPLHHPQFDIDESALVKGAATLALTALNLLPAD